VASLVLYDIPLFVFFEDDTCGSKLVGTFSVTLYCIYLRKNIAHFVGWVLRIGCRQCT